MKRSTDKGNRTAEKADPQTDRDVAQQPINQPVQDAPGEQEQNSQSKQKGPGTRSGRKSRDNFGSYKGF